MTYHSYKYTLNNVTMHAVKLMCFNNYLVTYMGGLLYNLLVFCTITKIQSVYNSHEF